MCRALTPGIHRACTRPTRAPLPVRPPLSPPSRRYNSYMVEISILVPAVSHTSSDLDSVYSLCSQTFGVAEDQLELFALVPVSEARGPFRTVAARLRPSSFSLQSIEDLLVQRDQLSEQLERSREALQTYSEQLEVLKKSASKVNAEKYHRRGQKLKQLDEDNKKLRQLLKTQLENSESLRVETQQTVETLRQEFDMLVKELMAFRKKEAQTTSTQPESKGRRVPKLDISAGTREKP